MSVVFTMGYEGIDIDRFVSTLKAVNVQVLADVRAVAASRKKGFSKKILASRLKGEGIDYTHLVDLGDPREGRDAARAGSFDTFRSIYELHLRSDAAECSLRDLLKIVSARSTCLLCFERDPDNCHRAIIAAQLSKSGFKIFHLYGEDPERYVRNSSRVPRYYPCQGATAAE